MTSALTPEEWAKVGGQVQVVRGDPLDRLTPRIYGGRESDVLIMDDWGEASGAKTPEQRHALAALALHGQSFGFTWADVDMMRDIVKEVTELTPYWHHTLADIADRIAALLPPRP